MLPWQLPNVRKKYQIFIQLVIASFCLHIIFAGWLFFGYREPGAHVRVTVNHLLLGSGQEIILIPTLNPALVKQNSIGSGLKRVAPLSAMPQKSVSPTTVTSKKITPQKTGMVARPAEKKIMVKKAPLPEPPKKMVEPPKPILKKEIIQKVQPKPVLPTKPTVEKLIEQKKEEIAVLPESAKIPLDTNADSSVSSDSPIVMHATPQEVEAYRQQQLFYQVIKKQWKPPLGLDKNCVCQITFTVGWQGSIQNVVIDIASGILMYDIAARSALYSIKMPEWSRGKH